MASGGSCDHPEAAHAGCPRKERFRRTPRRRPTRPISYFMSEGAGPRGTPCPLMGFEITTTRTARLAGAFALALIIWLNGAHDASAQDLQSRLDHAQAELQQTRDRAGVLTQTVERNAHAVNQLRGEIATLRNREAVVQQQLTTQEAELAHDRERLEVLKTHLRRTLNQLRNRLVDIYRTGQPDFLTVILDSGGFDDLLTRYEYLRRIEDNDASIVGQVRGLRTQAEITVTKAREVRRTIAARRAELARTRVELESREGELASALAQQRQALVQARVREDDLSDHVANLQDDIAAEIQAAPEPATAAPTLPAGPTQSPSSAGLIWPVEGVLTSPFGPRWGSFHPGIDIGAPMGTPIKAAKAGVVVNAGPNEGYGNFTCINHGGGLSTCYAHQSSFATSAGAQVAQGEVIGYVGSTGFSTGPHLHFEVRVSGQAVDPLGYL